MFEGFLAVHMEVNARVFDDKRNKSTITKCVSNDRSGHDDQKGYRIIKIGAILEG